MEITLEQGINKITKNYSLIIKTLLIFIIIAILISVILPKKYESSSIIQLPQIKGDIYTPTEAKTLITSSQIILPILEKNNISKNYNEFIKKNIEINLINELFTRNSFEVIPYIEINIKDSNARTSQKLNQEISNEFINQLNNTFKERLNTLENKKQTIEQEILNIQLEQEILKEIIANLNNNDLNTESISKIILLRELLSQYNTQIINLQKDLFNTEEVLIWTREPKILSLSQIPEEKYLSKILTNILLSVILGLIISIIYIFYKK